MKGRIHSLESFGTVDGPGVRFVVFVQGCPMRCAYCHNPDTWAMTGGTLMEPAEIFEQYKRNESFYKGGGITVTGGEPLMQLDFVTELFALAKQNGVHTCLDTSGIAYRPDAAPDWMEKLDKLLALTDLVMLDIKHIDPDKHRELTKQPNDGILAFLAHLNEKHVSTWIRHVVVPTITDDPEYLYQLGYYIGQFTCVKALDVLPYHTMGKVKYENLGLAYPLEGIPAMDTKRAVELKKIVLEGVRDRRMELNMLGRGM
ncbi:MAG: pyruvate formate-lyase-activating protein [Eubacteriales bacterium]|nr:pyruvate formate-lyase-activating protein [Eubacteriales bacterium]